MKPAFIKAILVATFASYWASLYAEEPRQLSYAPAVVTLAGTILEESYGDDPPSPRYRGHKAWILRLEKPISIRGIPGDPLTTEAKDVEEVHLNVDHAKQPIPKDAFSMTHFVATGVLYQPGTANFRRPIVLLVSSLEVAKVD